MRPAHDALGALVILAALALLALARGVPEPDPGACWLNHSGVTECPAIGPIPAPLIDTTNGSDIVL